MKNQEESAGDEVQGAIAWRMVAWLGPILLVIAFWVGFQLVYLGRVLPGVSADGVYLGGLSQEKAKAAIAASAAEYRRESIQIKGPNGTDTLDLSHLAPSYDASAVTKAALAYGHSGSFGERLHAQLRSFFGRQTSFSSFQYQDADVVSEANDLLERYATPVSNASFSASGSDISISSSSAGTRVNTGALVVALDDRLASMSNRPIDLPTYTVPATVSADDLAALKPKAEQYLSAPVTLNYMGRSQTIDPSTIAGWLVSYGQAPQTQLIPSYSLPMKVSLTLNHAAIQAYVSKLAAKVDQQAIDGTLTMASDGTPQIAIPGQDGRTLNQGKTVDEITNALAGKGSDRTVAVDVAVVKPAVTQDTITSLGITDHLSQGISYFAGSDANRIINVTVGAKKFNGVLIKPGATFSFNTILGEIGPEYGYAPGWVILGNKEEKQYGGGLCQVASTAYRAALLAGLPITQRTNHSYAVSWYTKPFGVPGVDATIYPPNPDLKFVNDTPGYILIETKIVGTTLTFDFYGTKTKYGQIRGPYFVTGSMDATKPSHTVFYRDVFDTSGKLMKTDTVNTYYQSSLNFPLD